MVHPPIQWKPPDPEPGTDRALGWAPTYYPGVTVREAAGKILLPPGGRMENIELRIRAIPAHSVCGTLFGPDGKPVPKVPVEMGEDLLRPIFFAVPCGYQPLRIRRAHQCLAPGRSGFRTRCTAG